MLVSDVDLLICVEGRPLTDDHWVRRWARNLKTGVLVDIGPPGGEEGRLRTKMRVAEAVTKAERPVLLVGYHSGVAAIARTKVRYYWRHQNNRANSLSTRNDQKKVPTQWSTRSLRAFQSIRRNKIST